MEFIKFSPFVIKIDEESKKNNSQWFNSITEAISIQMEGHEYSGNHTPYRLILRDFGMLNTSDSDFIVPSNYYFKGDIFIDIERKIAIRQKDADELEYWCATSYGLSFPFLFQLVLAKNNQSFIHSGAFSYKGKGVVLSAFGGIGKTALLAKISGREDFKLMGDDLNIVTATGNITAYLRPFCLYRYHKALFGEFYRQNRLTYLRPSLFWRLYNRVLREIKQRTGVDLKWSRYTTYASGYVTASPFAIFDASSLQRESVPLRFAFVVGRHDKNDKVSIAEISHDEFADFSLNVLCHEWDYMDKSFKGYLTFQNIGLSSYYVQTRSVLLSSISSVEKIYKITIPIHLKIEESTQILYDEIRRVIHG